MDWHELSTFLEVAEHQSFTRAAELLHLTQPAVSKRIRNLESQLGTTLFDRIGKRVALTDAGRALQEHGRALLQHRHDVERRLRDLQGTVAGPLRLATSHHIGLHHLAPVLRRFARTYPDVTLNVRFEDSEVAHELVRSGACELAVVTLDPAGAAELHAEVLWPDPLVFAAAADHALTKEGTLSLATLATQPAILPGVQTYTGRIVLSRFAEAGISLKPAMTTNYLETIAMLVRAGLGWSVLPATLVTPGSPKKVLDAITTLTVDTPALGRELGLISDPRRTLANGAAAFRSVLKASVP